MNSDNTQIEKAFNNWKHNAIHLTFPNGNSLSTTWDYGSYSDNHSVPEMGIEAFHTFRQSDTVEIMILKAPEKLAKKIYKKYGNGEDSVIDYLTMAQWLDIVKILSK